MAEQMWKQEKLQTVQFTLKKHLFLKVFTELLQQYKWKFWLIQNGRDWILPLVGPNTKLLLLGIQLKGWFNATIFFPNLSRVLGLEFQHFNNKNVFPTVHGSSYMVLIICSHYYLYIMNMIRNLRLCLISCLKSN